MKEIQIEKVMEVVRQAGTLMVRDGFEIHDKGSVENLVTSSDVAVQHFLTEKLSALLPGCGFLCEEEDFSDTAHECCISVALARGGSLVMGVVYSPWREELYSAEKGCGAFCNGRPIHVSARPFEAGLLYTAMSTYHKEFARVCSDIIFDIYMESNDVRRTGSAAVELC